MLLASIEVHRTKTPQAMLDALITDVRAFCGAATPNDDVTMVVVRYDG
jgi:serine phosphatase RsbU (regulator of sigma subunit)